MKNTSAIKELCTKFITEIIPLLDGDDDQILVIIYDKIQILSSGNGCVACSVEAALTFAELHSDAKHDSKVEKVH